MSINKPGLQPSAFGSKYVASCYRSSYYSLASSPGLRFTNSNLQHTLSDSLWYRCYNARSFVGETPFYQNNLVFYDWIIDRLYVFVFPQNLMSNEYFPTIIIFPCGLEADWRNTWKNPIISTPYAETSSVYLVRPNNSSNKPILPAKIYPSNHDRVHDRTKLS